MMRSVRPLRRLSGAARAVVDHLEQRQLLSASLSTSSSLMVFNAVENSSASQTESLTLTDSGTSALTINSITIVNDPNSSTQSAARFSEVNASSIPSTLAAGASFVLELNYSAISVTTDSALLDISSSDSVNPLQTVTLHGIGTRGLGGTNQPSLATILQAYDIPTYVGEGPDDANAATDTTYPYPPDSTSQEVVIQRFVKAGSGPVTIDVLASFTASVGSYPPYVLGTYTPGNPSSLNQLFTTPDNEYQSTYVQPQGATSFDPGSSEFGFYCISNVQSVGRVIYSEDALNTFDSTTGRHFRFFPMEEPNGTIVPDQYIMTSTEWNSPGGYDFTNIVAIVKNVEPAANAPAAPVLGLQNLNAEPGSTTMVFNRINGTNPSVGDTVHNTGVLQVNNTGGEPLIISSYTLTSGYVLDNPPTFPVTVAAGASLDLTIQFVVSSEPTVPYNETSGPEYPTGGGVYDGTLTLNSNDPNKPTATVNLAGWYQYHSENNNEPSLQSIVNLLYGWDTDINSTPVPDLLENNSTSGSSPTYYGQEVVSPYWEEANSAEPVNVQMIAAYHTEGSTSVFSWYTQGSPGSTHTLFTQASDDGQTIFPLESGSSALCVANFSNGGIFGFKTDTLYTDDSLNTGSNSQGGGHHFRFYPVVSSTGEIVPNTYILALDYATTDENYDFQDAVYLISNITPVTNKSGITAPQTTAAPPVPAELWASNTTAGNVLQWGPISYTNLSGYDVYSASSESGPYTLLTTSPISATSYTDTTAATGTTYYRVTAVDSVTANQSLPLTASATVAAIVSGSGDPIAAAESATTSALTPVTINDFPNATDASGTLIASSVTVSTIPGHGSTSVNASNGAITYTPDAGFTGTDTFQYTVADSTGAVSAPATVTITVTALPVGNPIAANLSYNAATGVALVINDAAAATDSSATLEPSSVSILQYPSHGNAFLNSSTGVITYVSDSGYIGTDTIQYTIGDNLGAISPTATITIDVLRSGPVVAASSTTVSANAANSIDVLQSASDLTGSLVPSSVTVTTPPLHGSATINTESGAIIYTPAAGYFGADTLQYTVADSNGVVSSPVTLSLDVGVTLSSTAAKSLVFTDSAGDKVTLALAGVGEAEIFFNGNGSAQTTRGAVQITGSELSIGSIDVTGTTVASTLTISRKGKGAVSLENLTVAGAIGKILAPTSNLTGTLNVSGAVTTLQLGSANAATITIGSAGATRSGLSITGTGFVNTTLSSATPIKSLKVSTWLVSGTTDALIAPSISSLVTTGNFQAGLNLSGASPFAMGTARIGGQVDAQGWHITGAAQNIVIGSIAPGWTGDFTGAVSSFTVRVGGFAGTLDAGSIGKLAITGNDTGKITAGSIKSARIVGQLDNAALTTTNGPAPKIDSLGSLTVTGGMQNSLVTSAGNIGSISTAGITGSSVDAGVTTGILLPTSAGQFTASDTISSFSVTGRKSTFTDSNIGAEAIGSLNLATVATANGGAPFGVAGATIKSLTAALSTGGTLHLNTADLRSASTLSTYLSAHAITLGDFEIKPGVQQLG
jgi:hypothetical protein